MAAIDSKFFLNLDLKSYEDEADGSIQEVFPNEMIISSRDNYNYLLNLKKQLKKLDELE